MPKKHRVLNCFSMGYAEHGRLGLGPPDEARMVFEAGHTIGWHQRRDPATLADVAVSNVRMRRTHVPGLARLAKLPSTLPEAAIGTTGGVVLPSPVGKPLAANGPRAVAVATGETHSLVALEDGRVFGWGNGADGQLGMDVIEKEVQRLEEVALSRKKIVTGFEEREEATSETTVPALSVWTGVLQPPPAVKSVSALGLWGVLSSLVGELTFDPTPRRRVAAAA